MTNAIPLLVWGLANTMWYEAGIEYPKTPECFEVVASCLYEDKREHPTWTWKQVYRATIGKGDKQVARYSCRGSDGLAQLDAPPDWQTNVGYLKCLKLAWELYYDRYVPAFVGLKFYQRDYCSTDKSWLRGLRRLEVGRHVLFLEA